MSPMPKDALEAGLELAAALEKAGLPYALGGALAYGVWAVPRGTVDVDINIYVDDAQLDRVFTVLESEGYQLDRVVSLTDAGRRGMFVAMLGRLRLDVFLPSIPFSWESHETRVQVRIDEQHYWFLSAEALCVFKLLFFRGKDLVDLERLIAVRGGKLDVVYVRAHIVELMGEDDERVAKWDELVTAWG